jgi:hypothetical protein
LRDAAGVEAPHQPADIAAAARHRARGIGSLDGAKKALKLKSTTPLTEPVQIVQTAAPANPNYVEIISKLEGIKAKLLNLPVQKESAQKMATPTLEKESTPAPIEPPKKRNVEKPKPASDMPTLFDF